MAGKRIGFVDYKLDNFHANVFLTAIREKLRGRGFSVDGCWALDAEGGKAWAAKKNVKWFDSTEALNEHVDAYMILAPSNPETHMDLCRRVLPFGKITYVDKTFAPDLKTAKEIFELADQHRTPVQTTSALRYTNVQKKVAELGRENLKHMTAFGGGNSFGEYAIHPVEMVISCMGGEAKSLMRRGGGKHSQLLVNFSGDRTATINIYTEGDTPFAATLTTAKSTQWTPVETSTLFVDAAAGILDFFDKGQPTIDRTESLMVRRILDAAEDPKAMKEFAAL
jgi:predicted dehydrogenase